MLIPPNTYHFHKAVFAFIVFATLSTVTPLQAKQHQPANDSSVTVPENAPSDTKANTTNNKTKSLLRYHALTSNIKKSDNVKKINENNNTIFNYMQLVKKYSLDISPKVFRENISNTLQVNASGNYWQLGTGRKYQINQYETHIFVYGEQFWNEIDDYGLLEQRKINCEEVTSECIDKNTFNDLRFTLSSFGLGGTIYYLKLLKKKIAFGFEVPLLSFHQLRLYSSRANNNFRINGISLLGMPVWRHGVITPLKIRYTPANWLSVVASVKYINYTLYHQGGDEYDVNREGDWIDGCDKKECSLQETSGQVGFEMLF